MINCAECIDRGTGRLNVLTFAETTLDLASNTGKPGEVRYRDAAEMPLADSRDDARGASR